MLKISRSSYYEYLNDKNTKRKNWRKLVLDKILTSYDKSRKTYGSIRITKELNTSGFKISKVTVAKIMKNNNIKSIASKKFKVTTNSKHKEDISPNLLNREFRVDVPSKSWVSDITYLRTQEGWLYLTTVIDLFDRKIIGYSFSTTMDTKSTVIRAFNNALSKRHINKQTIFHSDRGVQYASKEFRSELKKHTLKQSMSGKGDCWDNAVAESFFSTLKKECVRKKVFFSRDIAVNEVISYINWYNNVRLHSSLGYMSPLEFEIKFRIKNVA